MEERALGPHLVGVAGFVGGTGAINEPLHLSVVLIVLEHVEHRRIRLGVHSLAEGHELDNITDSGVERSGLLRRLRSGREALETAPPTSFGQPWYEVLEAGEGTVHKVSTDGKVTTLAELLGTLDGSATARSQMLVGINGCHWHIVKTNEFGKSFVVRFQGHDEHFQLDRGEGPDGTAAWTLRKIKH